MSDKKTVVVGVSGCIAAYKTCEIIRGLQEDGYKVRVMMTKNACKFVGPATFAGLTRSDVALDLFDNPINPIAHIALANEADLILIAPATADIIAKIASGIADDIVTSTAVAAHCPVLVAPAMNDHMWNNPATQSNVATLLKRSIEVVQPGFGRLACGVKGTGKLASVDEIVTCACNLLEQEQILVNKRVVISAGPTHEPIDSVRFLSNKSSGKMGYALAKVASDYGADVTLVSGPVALTAPSNVKLISVETASQMYRTCIEETFCQDNPADVFIGAAAVADYTPLHVADHKLKKSQEPITSIEVQETQDILGDIAQRAQGSQLKVIGFAAETSQHIEYAADKLKKKGCDAIIANDVSCAESTFGSDTNRISWVDSDGVTSFDTASKIECARIILKRISQLFA